MGQGWENIWNVGAAKLNSEGEGHGQEETIDAGGRRSWPDHGPAQGVCISAPRWGWWELPGGLKQG